MTRIDDMLTAYPGKPVFLCDYSPPKGADFATIDRVISTGCNCVLVAYSPGKSVRVDSAVAAHLIQKQSGKEVMFTLSCRDMNKLAIQSHLLGAQLLDVENVLVLQGDRFTSDELIFMKEVRDFRPTELIRSIKEMNQGIDFRGKKLRVPTSFCVGAIIDLQNKSINQEVKLTLKKIESGADFFITQTFFNVEKATDFLKTFVSYSGEPFPKPIFYGLPILTQDGLIFGDVPEKLMADLNRGKTGMEIALEQLHSYVNNGMFGIYIVPPIQKGGRRDYESVSELIREFSETH
jgi:homocysteine S-methyltransferase